MHFWVLGLGMALLLALVIRLPYFSQVPVGLNRDEAALGYNAYSLLKTGRDEYGKSWPISITSFGDQKLPGYVYTLIPFVAWLDLNPYSIRLPSLLAGLVTIAAVGGIAYQLSRSLKWTRSQRLALSWVTMLLVAISPWGNHFSRVAYEAHLAMALFTSGFFIYQVAINSAQKSTQRLLIGLTALLWSATLLTYHSYHLFTPLMVLSLLIVDRNKILKLDRIGLSIGVSLAVLTLGVLYLGGVWQANLVKNSGISPFNRQSLMRQATEFRQYFPGEHIWLEKLLFNSATEAGVRLAQNLVSAPGNTFLFVNGSGHGDHNPGHINNLHLFIAPLLIIGLKKFWDLKKSAEFQRLLFWLCVAIIPPALTIEPQHTIRFSPVFPILEIGAALGLVSVWLAIKQPWLKRAVVTGAIFLASVSVLRMVVQYWYIVPRTAITHESDVLLAETLIKYQPTGLSIITQGPDSSPYIWYLVATKYDPAKYQREVERYPTDEGGFIHVKSLGNLHFQKVDWDDAYQLATQEELILILKPTEIPGDKRLDPNVVLKETVVDSQGNLQYEIWSLDLRPKLPIL